MRCNTAVVSVLERMKDQGEFTGYPPRPISARGAFPISINPTEAYSAHALILNCEWTGL